MIISAPYRSGGTSLAIKLAEQNELKFVGQIDHNTIQFTKIEDKNTIHEYANQPMHTFDDVANWFIDDSDVVILNNSNPALFSKTHTFIIRDDFYRCYSSIYWMMAKLYPLMQPHHADHLFRKVTYFNALLLTHLKMYFIKPLILEEQDWYVDTPMHDIPPVIRRLAYRHVNYLKDLK